MVGCVLDRPTLVLNRSWMPVNVATVARSLTLLWNESALVVDPDDYRLYTWADWAKLTPKEGEPFIRTVTFAMRVPEVLTLLRHDRPRSNSVTFSRRNVFKRDHSTCQYCGEQPGTEELTIEPRHSPLQGRSDHLGKLRPGLCSLQRPQGEPDAGTIRDETAQAPDPTNVENRFMIIPRSGSRVGHDF